MCFTCGAKALIRRTMFLSCTRTQRLNPSPRHEAFDRVAAGEKLFRLSGRIWVKHWISPAQKSPRIRRDDVEPRVHFRVENQEQATLAGKDLEEYRGWLWFKPSVIRHILRARTSEIKWYTAQTGEIGPAPHQILHFGVNDVGLINVLGYKICRTFLNGPEILGLWQRRPGGRSV